MKTRTGQAFALLCLVAAAALTGCSGPPTGMLMVDDGTGSDPSEPGAAADGGVVSPTPATGDAGTGSTSAPGTDASMPGSPVVDAGVAATAFAGAPAFVATLGPSARKDDHTFAGNAARNPAGQACFTCHKTAGNAPKMVFGGTVFADVAGTIPAASVEVRVGSRSVFTDQDGNFYLFGDALTASSSVGARDATQSRLMVAPVTNGNCNGCHTGGTGTARIHLP